MAERSLRVALAIGIYEPDNGGAAEWIGNVAAWLAGRGHRVAIVCQRADAAAPEGCEIRSLNEARLTKNSIKRAKLLQGVADGCGADIVHDSGCLVKADVFHPLMGSITHNWVRQLRSYPRLLGLRRAFHVRLWRDVRLQLKQMANCRALVACSELAARDFRQLRGAKSVVIRNGLPKLPVRVEAEVARVRASLQAGERVVMMASASNFYLKGMMTLLRALKMMDAETRSKLLMVIAGRHPDSTFSDYMERHGLGDCCRMPGWLKPIDPYHFAAEVFVHPTYHDAGSLSTLKAIAAGNVVVSSRFDGSAELLTTGESGWVLKDPGNPRELAGVLTRLLDAGLRERLKAGTRGIVSATLQEEQFLKLEKLYLSLAKRGGVA